MRPLAALFILAVACGGASEPSDTGPKKKPPPSRQDTVRDVGPDGEGELPMEQVEQNMREVRAAVIEKGAGDPAVDDCVVAAFAGVTFSTSERGQRFQYSFTF
jgi:hypothetical protein